MNWKRVFAKLRWDRPAELAVKLLNRLRQPWVIRGRRRRWERAAPLVTPAQMPAKFSSASAARLWPGAADRSWIALAAQRWPDLHAAARQRALAAAGGRFALLGNGPVSALDPAGRIRWHDDFKVNAAFPAQRLYLDVPIVLPQEGADIKVPWELSRFQHVFTFLWTDPDAYRAVFLEHWTDWLAANPVARGVNWACAMDVALRAISWTAALAAWGDTFDEPTLRCMWAALTTHGHFIRDNLEGGFGPRTNHYFSDLVGLAVLGAVLTPDRRAAEWTAFATHGLDHEIQQQFAPDGLNRECSTTYHRLMLELATLGERACRVAGRPLSRTAEQRLAAAYRAIAVLCDSSGHVPLLGDNDSGRVFPLAERDDAHLEHLLSLGAALYGLEDLATGSPPPEVALLAGPAALLAHTPRVLPPRVVDGAALPDSGLFILGNARDRLMVRCGPLTYSAVGTHKHQDQLSITLTVGGQPLVIDPGQYCYTPWPDWRNRFIDSRAHNAVTVDQQPQGRFFTLDRMSYTLINETRPACTAWHVDPGGARFVGYHRGYRRLSGGGDHERGIVFDAGARRWTMTDRLRLTGPHHLEWHFCLHPKTVAQEQGGIWQLRHGTSSVTFRWLTPGPPTGYVEPAWYAPAYGCKHATNALVFRIAATGPVEQTLEIELQESR